MRTVLFVCTGNVCRSPMAQGLFAEMVKGRSDIEVTSAGIGAVGGQSPSPHSVEVMHELGIDIRNIRSKPLMADLVRRADFIFVMTYGHLDSMLLLFPSAAEKTFLLREFETDLPVMERELSDPIGQSREVYRECREQIRTALPRLLDLVLRSTPRRDARDRAEEGGHRRRHRCDRAEGAGPLLADCRGLSLRGPGRLQHRRDRHPRGPGPVANGQADSGIIIDKTGFGLSIAANKVQGVRAVLAHNSEMARLSREQHDANILCVAAQDIRGKRLKEILEAWMNTAYIGQRQESPFKAMEPKSNPEPISSNKPTLAEADPEIFRAIQDEYTRQRDNLELIASENFTSRAVMEAQGSCLTNKYAEGYPRKRWYGGCENADVVEDLAIARAKQLFAADHVNVQPHSGSQANAAVYFAMLQPGDLILTMDLSHGGHLTHGHKMNFSGRFYRVVHYGVSKETETIDYDALEAQAKEVRPKMITAGASAYSRIIDFPRLRRIADSCGALLFIDMAHIAGLVAAGVHPSPIPHADFVTTTTHKTLRGPRGGLVFCKEKFAKDIDSQVFPGVQGGPLMHVIAAKAVALGEALRPEFRTYQQQVVRKRQGAVRGDEEEWLPHRFRHDREPRHARRPAAEEHHGQGSLRHSRPRRHHREQERDSVRHAESFKAGGIRLGTPAVTTRGMREDEMFDIANLIEDAIEHRADAARIATIRDHVKQITARFPLPF